MSLKINLYRNNNERSANFGLVYGRCKNSKPIGLEELAQHMSDHNTPYSRGVIKGVLTDMVRCIRELVLDGYGVKLDDLAIFKPAISSDGVQTPADYDLGTNVKAVRLLCQATGTMRRGELKKVASLGFSTYSKKLREPAPGTNTGGNGGGGTNP
jgi:hypothetical protein